ncbi:Ig-like domain-containing protein [Pinibacter aurantiacus]|uniref:Gliding motility-associated C-terminal domain-containing protein n=1 Tax=Pinibacter aurantiacus TaxID=2851599 RepID=A0A9E2W9I6_9BACT|nr:gliding motility-associated C-terminal domain-containing protein [Pinibacter aurantiacus]MBV4360106.1 gliding motility-associated C-terminal domain-containing protein [Pinibacter aurantiacus]
MPQTPKLPGSGFKTLFVMIFLSVSVLSQAQFSMTETFANNNISPNLIIGNNAALTAASGIDPAGQGWLRLTNNIGQSGYCYINKNIPSGLGVLAEFEFKAWSTSYDPNADGFSMFLFDANYGPGTFSIGALGGALGYIGLPGAYIGIGLDEFGNNSNPSVVGDVSAPGFISQAITVRAPTSQNNIYLTGTGANLGNTPLAGTALSYGYSGTGRPTDDVYYRKARITVAPIGGLYQIIVALQTSPSGTMTNILTTTTATPPPANLKIGFAASTGSYWAYHEIRNLTVTTPGGVRAEKTGPQLFKNGDNVSYKVKVYNDGFTPQSGIAFTDSLPAGFQFGSIAFDNAGNPGNTFDANAGSVVNNVYTNSSLGLNGGSYGIITLNGMMALTDSATKQMRNTAIAKSPTGVVDPDLINDTSRFSSYRVPVINKKDINICGGSNTSLALATMAGAQLNWTVSSTGSVTGAVAGSGTADASGNFTLNQTVINTGTTPALVTYTITPSYIHTLADGSTLTATGTAVASTVTVKPMPATPIITLTPVCEGGDQIFKASSSTPGVTYNWTGPKLIIINDQAILQAATPNNTIYSVSATLNGCTSPVASTTLQLKPVPATPTISWTPTCEGADEVLTASTVTSGVTYNWTGVKPLIVNNNQATIKAATTADNGTYSVTATLDGCTSQSGTADVVIRPAPYGPAASYNGGNGSICQGSDLSLWAASATPGASYSWTGPNGFASNLATPMISNASLSAAGHYLVTATSNGCTSKPTDLNVVINNKISVDVNKKDVTCQGGSDGTIVLTASNGLAPYSYKWNNGSNQQMLANLPAASYNAKVTDANGCYVNTSSIVVSDGAALPPTPVADNIEVCEGTGSLTLSAEGVNLQWYNSDGSSLPSAPQISKGTPNAYSYYVNSKDALGCESPKTMITAWIKPVPEITAINKREANCNGYPKGIFEVLVDGGCKNTGYTFSLLNTTQSQISATFTNIAPGNYTVQVTDACGCSASQSVTMTVKMNDCDLQLPNAFTPNNDNKNDIFRPTSWGIVSDYKLQIYNRQGQMVFQSTRPEDGWNGSIRGMVQPEGTYVWLLNYKNANGELRNLKGTVVLLK